MKWKNQIFLTWKDKDMFQLRILDDRVEETVFSFDKDMS